MTLHGIVASIAELKQAEIVACNESRVEAVLNLVEVGPDDDGS